MAVLAILSAFFLIARASRLQFLVKHGVVLKKTGCD